MRLFIIALQHEAQILIDTFSLHRYTNTPFPLYRNDKISVVISGIGSIQAAAATSFALATLANIEKIINYGTCGAHPRLGNAYGTLYNIRKIVDVSTQKVFHLAHKIENLPQNTLYTFPTIQTQPPSSKITLADMEASGFYQAALRFVDYNQIYVWKLVTDYMENRRIGLALLQHLQQRHLPLLQTL